MNKQRLQIYSELFNKWLTIGIYYDRYIDKELKLKEEAYPTRKFRKIELPR